MSRVIEFIGDGLIAGAVRAILMLIVIGGFTALVVSHMRKPFKRSKSREESWR